MFRCGTEGVGFGEAKSSFMCPVRRPLVARNLCDSFCRSPYKDRYRLSWLAQVSDTVPPFADAVEIDYIIHRGTFLQQFLNRGC